MFVNEFAPGFVGSFFQFVVVTEVSGIVPSFHKIEVPPHNKVHIVRDAEQ